MYTSLVTAATAVCRARKEAYAGMQLGLRHVLEDFCELVEHGPGKLKEPRESLVISETLQIFEELEKGRLAIEQLPTRSLYPSDELSCMKFFEHIAQTLGEGQNELRPKTTQYITVCNRVFGQYHRRHASYDLPGLQWQPGEQAMVLGITQFFVQLMRGVGWSFYPCEN